MFGKNKAKVEKKETREERFRRIASRRVRDILNKLRLLGNCSDRTNYSYEDKQIKKIFINIEDELKRVKALFNKPRSKKNEFNL